jgi:hypothetical protein
VKQLSIFLLLMVSLVSFAGAQEKPFKRVLVISGGGINPGVALGMIAGVKEMGWKPDLVIATCGAGITSAVYNSEQSIVDSFEVVRSRTFFEAISEFRINKPNGIEMIQKLEKAKNTNRYPDIFHGNLLWGPQKFPTHILKTTAFNRDSSKTKFLFISSRALFGPEQAGRRRNSSPLFKVTYYTDPDTAEFLKGRELPAKDVYPNTTLAKDTLTFSHVDVFTAMRAGIADPYFLNPGIVDGHYQFTGAVDLYPIDLAVSLGEQVIAGYPAGLFLDYEDLVFKSGFGFKQTTKALEAIQHKDVKWMDLSGMDTVAFNPQRWAVVMTSGIPTDFTEYRLGIGRQWTFGHDRAKEALTVAPGAVTDVRSHLRRPINPELLKDFSCKNANEWKTDKRDQCLDDKTRGCERKTAKSCTPIR